MNKTLVYFAIKYEGNYKKIFEAIKSKEVPSKQEIETSISSIKSNYVTIIDEDYPKILKNLPFPPIVLFYYGDLKILDNSNTIAIIGTRKNSDYGKNMCKKLVDELVEYNPVIVSGMASGIDGIAQHEALDKGIKTVAVLGSGIDYIYPSDNKDLYYQIRKKGLILSEYPNNTAPNPANFLIRNRIIAGLSSKIVVVEARYKSGTMNTVAYGLERGKEIYAIPYPAYAKSGCNMLIKEGARLVEQASDLFD